MGRRCLWRSSRSGTRPLLNPSMLSATAWSRGAFFSLTPTVCLCLSIHLSSFLFFFFVFSMIIRCLIIIIFLSMFELHSSLAAAVWSSVCCNGGFGGFAVAAYSRAQGRSAITFGPTDLVCCRTLQGHTRKVPTTSLSSSSSSSFSFFAGHVFFLFASC